MKKELFTNNQGEAQKTKEANELLSELSPYVCRLVDRTFPEKHEFDREDIVNAVLCKVWHSAYCTEKEVRDIRSTLRTIAKNYVTDLYRAEKKHLHTYAFSSLEAQGEDAEEDGSEREFADENAVSPLDACVARESVREFIAQTIRTKKLHVIVKRFDIKQKYFEGEETSWREIALYIREALISHFTAEEARELLHILKEIPAMSVDKLYYKIYNETKSKKKKQEKNTAEFSEKY